jgi:2-polyprenyl-6-methoxyphenol hydroxylase-like FAD-dependent oxidoreductase
MMRAPRVAIVGGVGGLAAALALEQRGAEIVVCEQSNALSTIGAGLHLSPNALMALRALGVEDAVIAIGSESDFLIIRSWKSGRKTAYIERGSARENGYIESFNARLRDELLNGEISQLCARPNRQP